MKNFALILLTIIATTFTSCSNRKAMVQMNDEFVTINNTLFSKGQEAQAVLANAINTGDYSPMRKQRMDLEAYVATKLEQVRKMEDLGGSEALRHKEIEYLELEQELLRKVYRAFENFNANSTQEDMQAVVQEMTPAIEKENALKAEFMQLQKEWAAKNNITLK